MGQNSDSKIVIGVLSGVGTEKDLISHANFIVNTIHDALPIIIDGV